MTYFHMGTPYKYDGWTYEWQAGRQLKSMTHKNAQNVQDKKLEFFYDASGLRTQKKVTVGSTVTTTDYTLHGKLVVHQKVTKVVNNGTPEINELHFFYDAQSRPAMVNFNGILYTYVHNSQGDVVGIVDSNGIKVVEYKYDAWGKPLDGLPIGILKDTLGKLNPFRYRGYVHDEETSLYYLRSRYYNPYVGRFVCSDQVLGKVGRLLLHNQFSYCSCNPIMRFDANGTEWNTLDHFISDWEMVYGPSVAQPPYFVKLGDLYFSKMGKFYGNGWAVVNSRIKKIGKLINGSYMYNRTDFYDAMGIKHREFESELIVTAGTNMINSTLVAAAINLAIIKCPVPVSPWTAFGLSAAGSAAFSGMQWAPGTYKMIVTIGEVYNGASKAYESISTVEYYMQKHDAYGQDIWVMTEPYSLSSYNPPSQISYLN